MASISLSRAGAAQPCLVCGLYHDGDSLFASSRLSDSCDIGSESTEAEEVGNSLCHPLCLAALHLVVLFYSGAIVPLLCAI